MSINVASLSPQAQRQILQKITAQKPQKESKYHNKPDSRGKVHFDSHKEARRYDELMLMLKAGKILNLKLQPQFTLQESYITPDGERVRAIRYQADFSYDLAFKWSEEVVEWVPTVEDVKSRGTKTAVYAMKRKMMQEKFGIEVQEV